MNVSRNRYSTPWGLMGRRLEVRESKDRIDVFDGPRRVASHGRVIDQSNVRITLPEHRPPRSEGVFAKKSSSIDEARLAERLPEVTPYVPQTLRAPSMISANALVAGLMQLRLQALAMGTTPATVIGTQRYHLLEGTADIALCKACRPNCERAETIALGDLHDLPLGIDRDFEVVREEDGRDRAQNAGTETPKSTGTSEATCATSGGRAGSYVT